jgi:hypothetical protein
VINYKDRLFVFLQPELRSKSLGHYYNYIKGISESLDRRDIQNVIIPEERFSDNLNHLNHISFKTRSSYLSLERISKYNRIIAIWNIIIGNIYAPKEFTDVLNDVLKINKKSIIFIDTILNNRILGFAYACNKFSKLYPDSKYIVVFRFSYQSNSKIYTFLQKKFHQFFCWRLKNLISENRLFVITDSELLKNAFDINFGKLTKTLPIPLRQHLFKFKSDLNKFQDHHSIGFIGGKNSYKGLDIYLRIISNLSIPSLRFFIHGITDIDDLLSFAKVNLCHREFLELSTKIDRISVTSFLSEEEYYNMYSNFNFIIIPYSSIQFREGTSTIFTESVSSGIIPFVPINTWMSHELKRFELEELAVDFADIEIVVRQINIVINNISVTHKKIEKFIDSWKTYHSSEEFTNQLLSFF